MKTASEFESLPIDNLKKLIYDETQIVIPKGMPDNQVIDLAKNKLHGKHFIFDDELKKDNVIIKKPKKIDIKSGKCPNCSKNNFTVQPFPESSEMHKSKYCKTCGYWEMPNMKGGTK